MRLAFALVGMSLLAGTVTAQECSAQPPSRASSFYWGYLETCGCENVSPVSKASPDYKRFQKVGSRDPAPRGAIATRLRR